MRPERWLTSSNVSTIVTTPFRKGKQRILKPPTSSRVIALKADAEEDTPCAEDCGVLNDG